MNGGLAGEVEPALPGVGVGVIASAEETAAAGSGAPSVPIIRSPYAKIMGAVALARLVCHSAFMPRLSISVVFESGARIGSGKFRLLQSVHDSGSISGAARDMGMSYKRAWVLLDSINQAFTEPVVVASPGGAGGGGARLTPFGLEVLARYRKIADRTAALAVDDLVVMAEHAKPDAGPKV
jgi:molybdate transport system regulatory protein